MNAPTPPESECDLVLAGGVTSAVAYTGVIVGLSRTYRFRSLGGTSAGAAAAAAGAIAERSRRISGKQDPFEAIAGLPGYLVTTDRRGRTNLFKLFQPQPATRRGYRVIVSALRHTGKDRWLRALLSVMWGAVREFWPAAIVGAIPGLWLAVVAAWARFPDGTRPLRGISFGLGLTLAIVLPVCTALAWGLWSTARAMAKNHFGLCNGMPVPGNDAMALTEMLHGLYNKLAGRDAAQPPVVFGDLWGAGPEREIDLQVITTALDLKRPIRLPNDPGVDPLQSFFYDPQEWAALFPAPVMEWLRLHPRVGGTLRVTSDDGRALAPLPEPRNWPVVMAVRLSLSFPGLLSAIPMYVRENEWRGEDARDDQAEDVNFTVDKVYFSDGGITSNCPIHLFDAPLPAWPTFGVNLWRIKGDRGSPAQIWMHGGEPPPGAVPFHQRFPLAGVSGFIGAIIGTALDWNDSLLRKLPGYRERVVHIGLPPNEGGLNLNMSAADIIALSGAGERAAEEVVRQFLGPSTAFRFNAWELHRWVRMRSMLAATRQQLLRLSEQSPARTHAYPAYRDLPKSVPQPPPSFAAAAAAQQAELLMDGLTELMARVEADSPVQKLNENAPEPAPKLRMSSPW
jgi:predicted acylesterase/phospholipase RssA